MDKIQIENYKKAGKIASETVKYAKQIIKKNMLLVEIADLIEEKIIELGGECAFPTNLSLNEVAAHYTPGSSDSTKALGLLKVDIGVSVDGFIADTAFSLDLTDNKEHEKMIKLNEEALKKVLDKAQPGMEVKEIGNTIHEEVEEYNKENNTNFSIIKNLSGHELEQNIIHAGMTIPNYRNTSDYELDDMAIAIEPFLTTGAGEIYESSLSEIYMIQKSGSIRDSDARVLLKYILEKYETRPFCKRWLEQLKFPKLNYCLMQLTQQGILHNFPMLVEKSKKPVSQAEHTIIFHDKAEVTTLA